MSASEQFNKIVATYRDALEHPAVRQDSEEYQKALSANIEALLQLKADVNGKLALFSSNETLDDLSTGSLKFLAIDYYLAQMCARRQGAGKEMDALSKNRVKLMFLDKAVQLFVQFLISLEDYEILDKSLVQRVNSFKVAYKPTMDELYKPVAEASSADATELNMAYQKRQQKIEFFQRNKMLAAAILSLENRLKTANGEDGDGDGDGDGDSDDLMRELQVQNLRQFSYSAFNEIEQILYETEMLSNFVKNPPAALSQPSQQQSQGDDGRRQAANDETNYTDRLESLNKPLLSKNGKILRNFTLVDKKSELRDKVRGYGQYGPTMTVEELLEKEWEEGRVLQGGPDSANQPEVEDEDDMAYNDRETYKAREWDDFTESHAKGSGNTTNMG